MKCFAVFFFCWYKCSNNWKDREAQLHHNYRFTRHENEMKLNLWERKKKFTESKLFVINDDKCFRFALKVSFQLKSIHTFLVVLASETFWNHFLPPSAQIIIDISFQYCIFFLIFIRIFSHDTCWFINKTCYGICWTNWYVKILSIYWTMYFELLSIGSVKLETSGHRWMETFFTETRSTAWYISGINFVAE